jgi:hypothetical protein
VNEIASYVWLEGLVRIACAASQLRPNALAIARLTPDVPPTNTATGVYLGWKLALCNLANEGVIIKWAAREAESITKTVMRTG